MVASALLGGTVSKLSGGKFANGASTGAFQNLFNQQGVAQKDNYDYSLEDVTEDRSNPMYKTAKGTLIALNKPAPDTVLPGGDNLKSLIRFADGLGVDKVWITGGAETKWHTPRSAHYNDLAIDVSVSRNPGLTNSQVANAAVAAGYTHGQLELYTLTPSRSHWHLQISGRNYRNEAGHRLYENSMAIQIKNR